MAILKGLGRELIKVSFQNPAIIDANQYTPQSGLYKKKHNQKEIIPTRQVSHQQPTEKPLHSARRLYCIYGQDGGRLYSPVHESYPDRHSLLPGLKSFPSILREKFCKLQKNLCIVLGVLGRKYFIMKPISQHNRLNFSPNSL